MENGIYETVKVLKKTVDVEVSLVRHVQLDRLRIRKKIRIGNDIQGQKEAYILRDLDHPGIPVLYDLTVHEGIMELIEEYAEGESLSDFLLSHVMTEREIVDIAYKVAKILAYLHGHGISHRDLKPEHIIIRGKSVRLIDYGISGLADDKTKCRFGTGRYMPIDGSVSDGKAADIFSFAIIIEEMVNASHCSMSYSLRRIIRKGKNRESGGHYRSFDEILPDLLRCSRRNDLSLPRELPSSIAVAGFQRGCGCTHIAISLTILFRHAGQDAWYDGLQKGNLENILMTDEAFEERQGIIYHELFEGMEDYGSSAEKQIPPDGIRIIDRGDGYSGGDAELDIYVISGSLWKMRRTPADAGLPDMFMVNPWNRHAARKLIEEYPDIPVMGFPADGDAFSITEEEKVFFRSFLKIVKKDISSVMRG